VIYLDHAATSCPKPPQVIAAVTAALEEAGNPARGAHRAAQAAIRSVESARLAVSQLLGVGAPWRTIFTSNGTDALDLAIHGTLNALPPSATRPHVVTSDLEHNSVARPLEALRRAGRIDLTVVAAGDDGLLAPESIAAAIDERTVLVAVTMASNAIGTLQPAAEIVAAVRTSGDAILLFDAAQVVGSVPMDFVALGADLVAAPGHKGLLGPTGTGVLLLGERVAPSVDGIGARIAPVRSGGTGGDSTSPIMPSEFPWRLEAGTPNVAGLAGLAAGVRWVHARGVNTIQAHESQLIGLLIAGLTERLGASSHRAGGRVRIVGTADPERRIGVVSLAVAGIDPHEIASILDAEHEIAVRPGLHCAPGAHRAVGTFPAGTVRVSVGPTTTVDEIERLLAALVASSPSTGC